MTSESVPDYPQPAAQRGRVEPAPRRVRGFTKDRQIFDTTAARYVWEVPYYPQYYVPLGDVNTDLLIDEDHSQKVQFGPSRLYSIVGRSDEKPPVRVFDADGGGPVAGLARFEFASIDWFEEEERIVGHPRNPYSRVDALRSHRHVSVELDGVVLADSRDPVLLFETGLPTRYYLDRSDVRFEHLLATDTQTLCPYKGTTTGYWSVKVGDTIHSDLAWSYDYPLPAVAPIAGLIAFYGEKLDIVVDGVRLPRPTTLFS
ncbi:DUF427 domain-containing protein [Mycolicibacterium sp. 050158]|uniref:DUF427 domain-containing protein n=1 Tax=Mycolicibacterium sp. 050158 TaxID=3090602 RepID=UPI00299F33C2|nr:DUF427 domain-containing protein [Mycolicibacterium sp. 050158]MDX1890448.1 DUF427 domain-containing protein [Mycolicibacterium sp. 050158]